MQNDNWDINTAEKIKVIKMLVYEEQNQLSLIDYMSGISDLIFTVHASEMRYGETHYYRGMGKNIKATILPTTTLSALPRKYRKREWFYVQIYCHPDDARFDVFLGYRTLPAGQYNV
jgi:hypothetical protein